MIDNGLKRDPSPPGIRWLPLWIGLGLALAGGWIPYAIVDLGLREWAAIRLDPSRLGFDATGVLRIALPVATALVTAVWFARRRLFRPGAWLAAAFLVWAFAPLSTNGAALSAACAVRLVGAWLIIRAVAGAAARPRAIGHRLKALPDRGFCLALFAVSLAFNAFVAWWVFGLRPSIIDTLDQTFQAHVFLTGQLTAPAPPIPRAFEFLYMIVRDGHWYSHYPPGHPATLAVGLVFGASWMVGPVLGALLPVFVWRIGTEGWGRRTGRIAGALALAAPYVHLMSGSHMSHTTCATALAFGAWGLLRLWRGGGAVAAAMTGIGFGHALWTRPYPALAMSAAAAAVTLLVPTSRHRIRIGSVVIAMIIGAIPIGLLLAYNHATNGHALVFGYNVTQGPLHALGFGERTMNELVRHYTWRDAIQQTGYHLGGLNTFSLGTLIPALALAPWVYLARRRHPFDLSIGVLAATPCVAFFFYPFTDFVLGPRLVFATLPFLCVLVARSLIRLGRVPARPRLVLPSVVVSLLVVTALPDLAGAAWFNRRLHHDFPAEVASFVQENDVGDALVLCAAGTFETYGFGEIRPGFPAGRPVFARDRHAVGLMRHFSGRRAVQLARVAGELELTDVAIADDLFARLQRGERAENRGFQTTRRTLDVGPIRAEPHDMLFGFATPAIARYDVDVPEHAYLRLSAIVHPDAWPAGSDGVTFRVRIRRAGAEPVTLFEDHIGPADVQMRLLDREIDLRASRGTATIWLEALPGPAGNATGDVFVISTPCIVTRRPR